MKAVFVELPAFARALSGYLDDEAFAGLQERMMADPRAGPVIQGTGGLRKLRHPDSRRGKGRRGGLRVIYFWWEEGDQFWLFTLYGKDEAADLTAPQRKALAAALAAELETRRPRDKEH